ncbi:binding-protein-dependent transport systems inner membrane component [Beutenbergia cavernae DSM 12333]|uniref:Binding-protein-dependent transport systems inner membrane component n=1 Tax=Beutenbergia cavernae (strain ATCC BAA-8 / DSM 12333 / CCUG 43141 / JCM 11478 / NBRC 16432 / NCIMB 13614 / HKI 0122) TaxID=471853 RepID=C5BXU0_BEUC1|nr:sugar ABC transporter permease [Beutenbergia cavernae]ACQ78834.1 binding-protein-dependent transport systems inner membrane component [Beutenbergia cavernae DSM 12333]
MSSFTAADGRLRGWQLGFTAPLFVVLALTTILPIVYALALALGASDDSLTPRAPFSGENFSDVFGGREIWSALWLAVVFLVGALALELALGVLTALVLDRFLPNRNALRVLLLWPAVLPPIAVALVFKYILQGDIGMVSYYLGLVGIHQEWLTQPGSAMAVIIGIDVWQYTPFVILLTLAALKTVPEEVLEAAQLDGAGAVRSAWSLVLPIVRPAVIAIALLRFIDAIQVFPTIYVLTRGGPGSSTQLLTYYNFQVFFGQLRFGEGAAIAVFVVVFTLVCVTVFTRLQRRAERAWA